MPITTFSSYCSLSASEASTDIRESTCQGSNDKTYPRWAQKLVVRSMPSFSLPSVPVHLNESTQYAATCDNRKGPHTYYHVTKLGVWFNTYHSKLIASIRDFISFTCRMPMRPNDKNARSTRGRPSLLTSAQTSWPTCLRRPLQYNHPSVISVDRGFPARRPSPLIIIGPHPQPWATLSRDP